MSRTMPLARWLLSSLVLSGMLFACSGRIHAPIVAAYLAVFAGTGLVTAVLTHFSQDDERRKPGPEEIHPNSRRGATALFLATLALAALDAGRFHWTTFSGSSEIVALVVLVFAAGLQVWAMKANPFFSTAIRIQIDRRHRLVMRGPYRLIRHPGYLAMVIIMPATAVVIGSKLALLPAFCYSALILWRLQREDEFLAKRLVGYADYTARVRCRLVPSVW